MRRWKFSLPEVLTKYLGVLLAGVSGERGARRNLLVGLDAGSLEGFGAYLLVLLRDHVHAEGEFVDIGTLTATVEDADLWVWNSAVVSGFRERLVFAVPITSRWASRHFR